MTVTSVNLFEEIDRSEGASEGSGYINSRIYLIVNDGEPDQYLKIDTEHDSYGELSYIGEVKLVTAQPKTITVYE